MTQNKNNIDLDEIILKLIQPLKETEWYNLFKTYLVSNDFKQIFVKLMEQIDDGYRFTPPIKYLFTPFLECPLDKTKVIIISASPSESLGVSNGLAFSSLGKEYDSRAVKIISNILFNTNQKKYLKDCNMNLTRWANQGILLLNQSLTTKLGVYAAHTAIWKDFFMFVIDMVLNTNKSYLWVLIGDKTHYLKEYIHKSGNKVILLPDPLYFTPDIDFNKIINENLQEKIIL